LHHAVLDALRRWLGHQALLAAPVPGIAAGFADRLLEAGLPLWRAYLAASALDPETESIGLTWLREGAREFERYAHGSFERISKGSPIYDAVVETRRRAANPASERRDDLVTVNRYRLERGEGLAKFPVLVEFRGEGATDYLVFVILFARDGRLSESTTGAVVTLATDRSGGFADADVAEVAGLMPVFGAAVRSAIDLSAIRTALATYLGREVGERVLRGDIRRGSVEAIRAAILFADLRGFTALADEIPRDGLVDMLDGYMECVVEPIEARGGQVLKFLGDGMLATFSLDGAEASEICARALAAASDALRRIEAVNGRRRTAGLPWTTLDIALHAGEVLYGNVGSDRRLDFTVVGPAVNEASRLESLCDACDVPLVASRGFVALLDQPSRFRSLGERRLRGVRNPIEVLTLA